MKRHSGWMRIAIAISTFWLVGVFLISLEIKEISAGLFFVAKYSIIPLIVAWVVVWWIVKGFMPAKTDKAEDEKEGFDSVTKELRDIEVKLNKVESELSKLEKTK